MSKGGQHCPTLDNIETAQKVADDLDMSKTNLKKAQYIYNNATEEMIKQLDETEIF